MPSLPLAIFALTWLVSLALMAATVQLVPATVATHFGFNHLANGWMSRTEYLIGFAVIAGLAPFVIAAAIGLLPRRFPRAVNLPRREYWFAPERREETLASLFRQGCWLGALHALFASGVYALLLVANLRTPPRLDPLAFTLLLVAFAIGVSVWLLGFFRRFRVPRPRR